MEYQAVTFYGEKDIRDEVDLACALCETLITLISHGAQVFLFGNNDAFDRLASKVIRNLQRSHPHLSSVLVVSPSLQAVSTKLYDQVIALPADEDKDAYLAARADAVIVFAASPYENPAPLLTYAKEKQFFLIHSA